MPLGRNGGSPPSSSRRLSLRAPPSDQSSGQHRTHWTTHVPPKVYWCGVGRHNGLRQYELTLYPRKTRYPENPFDRSRLSIRRVDPILTASTASVPGGLKVRGSTTSAYSTLASG